MAMSSPTYSTSDSWEAAYYWCLGFRPDRVDGSRPRSTFVFSGIPAEAVDAYRFDKAAVSPKAFGFAYRNLLRLIPR